MESQINGRCTAVTFDFWNTLAAERPGYMRQMRIERMLPLLTDAGFEVDVVSLGQAVDSAFDQHWHSWHANTQFLAADGLDHALAKIGVTPDASLRADLRAAFELQGLDLELEAAPGIGEALEFLRSEGVAIGIICDVGFTPSVNLRSFLRRTSMLEYFNAWSFSDEVGHYKPSPAIFEHALSRLKATPASAAHVGDLRRTDVAGARLFGMHAIRYRGLNDDRSDKYPEADTVISHHVELAGVLGL